MKNYYDLTEKERASLTEKQIEEIIPVVLMSEGVVKPPTPDYETELEEIKLQTKTYYEVFGLIFDNTEEASILSKLKPYTTQYEYNVGYNKRFPVINENNKIIPVELYNRDEIEKMKMELTKQNEIKERNEKKREEHSNMMGKVYKITNGVWSDWQDCKDKERQHRKILSTFDEYILMAENEAMAFKFLQKVYATEQIKEASDWLQDEKLNKFIIEEVKEEKHGEGK